MAQINFSYDPGTGFTKILAFETAGKIWETYLQDNTSINIHVGITDSSNLPSNVIGGALPGMKPNTSYHEFDTRHGQDITSQDDRTAYNNNSYMTNRAEYQLRFNDGQVHKDFVSSNEISMTRANAKALGINVSNANGIDGYILMSNLRGKSTSWDHDSKRERGAVGHKLDFMSTALHEIGHVLGFVSGVDEQGWTPEKLNKTSSQFWRSNNKGQRDQIQQAMAERLEQINPLDLYRYSSATAANQNPDISYGNKFSEKYFSIDGGQTKLASFSGGADKAAGGDGYQASHWKQKGQGNNIMEPALTLGRRSKISSLDLRAMDVIGWDIASGGAARSVDFKALYYEAKRELAARIGKSTSWLDKSNGNRGQAARMLTQDRGDDLYKMLESSQYDMSWLNPWATGGRSRFQAWRNFWANGGSQRFQMLGQVFEQRSRFSTLNEITNWDEVLSDLPASDAETVDPFLPNVDPIDAAAFLPEQISPQASLSSIVTPNVVTTDSGQPSDANPQKELLRNSFETLDSSDALNSFGASDQALASQLDNSLGNILATPLTGLTSDQLLGSGLSGLAAL